MATIPKEDYSKSKYWTKEKQDKWRKDGMKSRKKSLRTRRTSEQKVADDQQIWEWVKEGKTNKEIHNELNELRGYDPPLKLMTISNSMRDLKEYHKKNMAYELHPYQEKKIVTAETLEAMALAQFQESIGRTDKTKTVTKDAEGNILKIVETESKQQSSVQWFKMLLKVFETKQELLGNLKGSSTIDLKVGNFNIDGKEFNLSIAHRTIDKLSDEKFGIYLEKIQKGEYVDIEELYKQQKMEEKTLIIDG